MTRKAGHMTSSALDAKWKAFLRREQARPVVEPEYRAYQTEPPCEVVDILIGLISEAARTRRG